MKHLFKPQVFKMIMALLVFLLVMKTLWFIVEVLWLPTKGIDHIVDNGSKSLYYKVKLTPNDVVAPTVTRAPVKREGSITDIKLWAIYNASDATVITVSYKGKTKVLGRGDEINGFVLEGAGSDFATFSNHSKSYKLMLVQGKYAAKNSVKASTHTIPSVSEPSTSEKPEGSVTDAGDHKVIDRALLDHYANNMEDIYKNIGITELKEGNAIKGFRITFVRKDSDFSKLGIRRDDVIKSINGQEINSYNAAFEMYKNIKNVENLTLMIQRGKDEMELEYEIN